MASCYASILGPAYNFLVALILQKPSQVSHESC